jgi:hypothetical protein
MKRGIQLAAFVFITCTLGFAAGSWSGYLVDYECYQGYMRHGQSTTTANRDMNLIVKLCVPTEKTKSFGIVPNDWKIVNFDPDGNAKAADFFKSNARLKSYWVTITGELETRFLKIDSISLGK